MLAATAYGFSPGINTVSSIPTLTQPRLQLQQLPSLHSFSTTSVRARSRSPLAPLHLFGFDNKEKVEVDVLSAETDTILDRGGMPTIVIDSKDSTDAIYNSAIKRTLAWVAAAGAFGSGLYLIVGPTTAEEFFAGYLLEQSLSIDNVLVFLLLFDYFKVPLSSQDRVLNFGIYGAFVMRAIMIGLGSVALYEFHGVLLVFAGILLYSSATVLLGDGDDDEEDEDMSENAIVQLSKNLFDSSEKFDGDRFFTIEDGVKRATPLLICMVAVEISDVVFAVDSIPAVFGVTEVSF
jgi:TerC family integral membrane protein